MTTDEELRAYVEEVIATLPPLDGERRERITAIFANA